MAFFIVQLIQIEIIIRLYSKGEKMKISKVLSLLLSAYLITPIVAMEPQPTPKTYRKPLPPIPAKQPVVPTAQISNLQPAADNNNLNDPKLTPAQEKSIQKIIQDINKITENSASIVKHSIELGKTASLSNIVSNTKDSATILAKLTHSSLLIGTIYLNMETFSHASPEVKALARKKILTVLESPEFKESEAKLIRLADDNTLPTVIKTPVQKLATQLAELPGLIVKKYLGHDHTLEAR